MNYSYTTQMRMIVDAAEPGTLFVSADFVSIASADTVRRLLNRLGEEGTLRRVVSGVYQKPQYSEFLKEYVCPDPDEVARALARNYNWTIAPYGIMALNLLGLSTQVPAVYTYVSDGPYRTYDLNGRKIDFKHRTNKEITGLSYITIIVIQALKAIGKDRVTDKMIRVLKNHISSEDKAVVLKEASKATDWVYETIKKICL